MSVSAYFIFLSLIFSILRFQYEIRHGIGLSTYWIREIMKQIILRLAKSLKLM